MNASRLLFEGLEDRVLLSGFSAALIAVLPRHTDGPYSDTTTISNVLVDDGGDFTLPKFDDHGGTRTLVGATLNTSTTVIGGAHTILSMDVNPGTVSVLTLTLRAESSVVVVSPTLTFDFGPIDLTTSLPGPTAIPSGGTVSVSLAGQTTDPQQETVTYPDSRLDDFVSSPGDTTIQFVAASSSAVSVTVDIDSTDYPDPAIRYSMPGSVTYVYVMPGSDEDYYAGSKYVFRKPPAPQFQPFYSGTAQPGATLSVDVLGPGGEVLGSASTIVDAGGNWAASFYGLGMTGGPHTVSIRQSYTGNTPLTGAGYNLRRYFSPAVLGGAYASEHLTVENVLGNRAAAVSMTAIYSASAHPITLGPTLYAYEMLPMSASPQGLH